MTSPKKILAPALLALALAPSAAFAEKCQDCDPGPIPNRSPDAQFDYTASSYRNTTISLDDASTDPDGDQLTVVGWDLDGDGTYTEAAGAHSSAVSFATAGDHKVGLRVSDGEYSSTVTHTIHIVNRAPAVTLTADHSDVHTGSDVTLTATGSDPDGDNVHYQWSFNGGDFQNLSHQVIDSSNKVGTETVVVRAIDALGAVSATAQVTIQRANRAPVGKVVSSAQQPFTGQSVDFDASTSADPDGSIASYEWYVDNAKVGTGPKLTRSFPRASTPKVQLLIEDNLGAKTLVDVPITVRNRPPTAAFTSSATTVATKTDATFDGSGSSDPETAITRYEWDFDGDGVYETDGGAKATIVHQWTTGGTRTVGLRVTDADGGTATTTTPITVTSPVAPSPSPSPSPSPTPVQTTTPAATATATATATTTPDTHVVVDPTPQPTVTPAKVAPTAPLSAKFSRKGKRARVKVLSITPAAGVTVTVSCSGKGCGFKTRSVVATGAKVNLKPLFRKPLRKGAKITVSLSKDGLAGSNYTKTA